MHFPPRRRGQTQQHSRPRPRNGIGREAREIIYIICYLLFSANFPLGLVGSIEINRSTRFCVHNFGLSR